MCTPDPNDPAKASFVGGSCGQVTCSEGLTIENSITTCGGLAGDVCFYLCEMGFQPTGPHICGMDGWFRGGRCEPAICIGGNIIPNSPTTCRGHVGDVCSASPHPPSLFPVSMVCH